MGCREKKKSVTCGGIIRERLSMFWYNPDEHHSNGLEMTCQHEERMLVLRSATFERKTKYTARFQTTTTDYKVAVL